jgi:hypothetical protein
MNKITGKCELLRDKNGQPYLAVDIGADQYSSYANFMLNNNFYEDVQRKLKRDSGCYHVTLINAAQWGALTKRELNEEIFQKLEGKEISFESFGIGLAEKEGNKAYFVILENNDITKLRESYGLQSHDFHMTLAFNEKDVHGVPKNKDTCVYPNDEIMKLTAVDKIKNFRTSESTNKLKP